MDGLDFFQPSEGGESYDPAAFERFKEQMKKNAAFTAAARKSEQKQKEKEDRLAKLLLKFIQNNQKSGILMLASKCLSENIPASFILSMIILGNTEMQEQLKKELSELLDSGQDNRDSEFALAIPFANQALPLKLKAQIDAWWKGIFEAAQSAAFRMFETTIDKKGQVKKIIIDCAANVFDDFLASENFAQISYDTCFSFCEFCMKGIFQKLKKQMENQQALDS